MCIHLWKQEICHILSGKLTKFKLDCTIMPLNDSISVNIKCKVEVHNIIETSSCTCACSES